jgi:hypothetical protein
VGIKLYVKLPLRIITSNPIWWELSWWQYPCTVKSSWAISHVNVELVSGISETVFVSSHKCDKTDEGNWRTSWP